MEEFYKIFSSPPAVAIAWICTVVSCIYAFIQKNKVVKIEQKYNSLSITHENLKIQNNLLEQKIIDIENNNIHDNYQKVNQKGKTNINQGVIKGDFHFTQR